MTEGTYIGTNNEDGSGNFAPITRVSVMHEAGDGYLPVISMFGSKTTGRNVLRTGVIGANLVNREMLPLMTISERTRQRTVR